MASHIENKNQVLLLFKVLLLTLGHYSPYGKKDSRRKIVQEAKFVLRHRSSITSWRGSIGGQIMTGPLKMLPP